MPPLLAPRQTFVVTGAAGGIGTAIIDSLLEEGGSALAVDRNQQALDNALERWTASGYGPDRIAIHAASITDDGAADEAVAKCLSHFGRFDTLVNNAGITKDRTARRMSRDEFEQVLDVNLVAAFLFAQAAVKSFATRKDATSDEDRKAWSIVNISSVIGLVGNFGQTNYAASKWGLIGMAKSLALETASLPVRVNAIAPGFTATPMTAAMPPEVIAKAADAVPMGRMANTREIADAVVMLSSPRMSYVTGAVLAVDGGYTAR